VKEYARREPDAVTLVHEFLTDAGVSMDSFMADALAEKLDDIERIDRLTTIAESSCNASLHEIDRRRAVLGETLRRSVREIEDGEFKVIETTPANARTQAHSLEPRQKSVDQIRSLTRRNAPVRLSDVIEAIKPARAGRGRAYAPPLPTLQRSRRQPIKTARARQPPHRNTGAARPGRLHRNPHKGNNAINAQSR
jgi:hypothetical protein